MEIQAAKATHSPSVNSLRCLYFIFPAILVLFAFSKPLSSSSTMKNRFSTLDLIAILPEIRAKLVGQRVNQVYDVDGKTYTFRFAKTAQDNAQDESMKQMLLLESGIRLHITEFDWPKSHTPSGFTMKLRKHIRNKRLDSISQVGSDRIVDIQFGQNEFAVHIILELFSKGNIVLTDERYTILSLLRNYKDPATNVNIAPKEKYPINKSLYVAKAQELSRETILELIKAQNGKELNFKKVFNPSFSYGPTLLEHCFLEVFQDKENIKLNSYKVTPQDVDKYEAIFKLATTQIDHFRTNISQGYITKKSVKRANSDEVLVTYDEFHPFLFNQFKGNEEELEVVETFNKAVDIFFSHAEAQKIESKVVANEKQAMKKLDAIKQDHQSRLDNLNRLQQLDNKRAQLIESNVKLVDSALLVLRSALASKYSWDTIKELVKDAQDNGDFVASKITALKLEKNCFSMSLENPNDRTESMVVDIDIGLTTYANARKYYDHRKEAAKKEQKTIDHSEKIFKNVEKKVKQQLKETQVKSNIVLARKVMWFEKFIWFLSSEGYLVICGRDMQQNELIVKVS